jgi:hypothetical protein
MTPKRLKLILFLAVVVVVFGYYFYASAPTASFWDCSEFIATGYSLAIPHPPSTPLFVQLARLVSFIPWRAEIPGRITMISGMFGSVCCGLIFLLVVYLVELQRAPERKSAHAASGRGEPRPAPRPPERSNPVNPAEAGAPAAGPPVPKLDWVPYLSGVVAAFFCAFMYSFMWNTVEAILFTPAATVAVATIFIVVLWYIKEGRHMGDNRIVIAAFYTLFLSTGIHFTPIIMLFALLPFFLIVDRRAVVDLRLAELLGFFLILLVVDVVPGLGAKLLWGIVLAVVFYFGMKILEKAHHDRQVLYAMLIFVGMFLLAYLAGMSTEATSDGARNLVMDNVVLFLASPIAGLLDRMFYNLPLFLIFCLAYAGYLYYLYTHKKLSTTYALFGLFLILLAGSVQFFLLVRAHQHPHVNEVDPSTWKSFASSLRREQYNAMRLFPRQTQYLLEGDYQNYRNAEPNYGLLAAYFEQLKYYLRYFLWQWAGRYNFDFFVTSKTVFLESPKFFPILVGLVPPFLGIWGIVDQWKRERKTAVLMLVAFLIAGWGLLSYLNNKFSTSDPRAASVQQTYRQEMYREVRERDYFYAFSFILFTVFVGIGVNAFFRWLRKESRDWFHARETSPGPRMTVYAAGVVALILPFLTLSFNHPEVNRRGNWIPSEYGFNVLVSCENGSVIFTNGDNDTFPLWMIQEVPSDVSRVAAAEERARPDYPKDKLPKTLEPIDYGFRTQIAPRWGVAVANLSLSNTDWYCRQLKDWGAPMNLTYQQIDQLSRGGLTNRDGTRHLILSQVMIRDLIATNGGIKLKWPDDYALTSEDFRAKVFTKDYSPKIPIYFATTVSPENLKDVDGHLIQKGLAKLVVPQVVPPGGDFDGKTTIDLVFNKMRLSSSLDPRVAKDENTKGLLINYAVTFLDIAQYCDSTHDTANGLRACDMALRLDLEKEKRSQLMYLVSHLLAKLGATASAQARMDTAIALSGRDQNKDPQTQFQVMWNQALILKAEGKLAQAESLYQNLVRMAPELYWELYDLYRTGLKDNEKAANTLDNWYRSVPQNWDNTRRLVSVLAGQLQDKARANLALDTWLKRNPKDTQKVRLMREAM